MLDNSYLEINTGALKNNVRRIAGELGPGVKLIPVLKDNAYGMGAVECMRAIEETGLADIYAVSHVAEAVQLRQAGLEKDIMALAMPLDTQLEAAIENDVILTLGRPGQAEEISRRARGKRAKLQIKIDTGLHRIGFTLEELPALVNELKEFDGVIYGTFSHFSDSGSEGMARQYRRYTEGVKILEQGGIRPGLRHIASSASFEMAPFYSLDAVRIGRRLYMDNPCTPTGKIEEVPSFRSFIADIRRREAGERLGYGGTAALERDSDIAVLNLGYGDGLNTGIAAVKGPVLVNGVRCPVLATYMDQCSIDVTGVECKAGDEVTLFGRDGKGNFLSSQEAAEICGADEGCGLTSALGARVRRIYTE